MHPFNQCFQESVSLDSCNSTAGPLGSRTFTVYSMVTFSCLNFDLKYHISTYFLNHPSFHPQFLFCMELSRYSDSLYSWSFPGVWSHRLSRAWSPIHLNSNYHFPGLSKSYYSSLVYAWTIFRETAGLLPKWGTDCATPYI